MSSFNTTIATPLVNWNGNPRGNILSEWNDFRNSLYVAKQDLQAHMGRVMESFPHESFHLRNHPKTDVSDMDVLKQKREMLVELTEAQRAMDTVLNDYHDKCTTILKNLDEDRT